MKLIALLCASLAALSFPALAADKIRVASFSTILTEIAEQVGGDHAAVTGLVKPGVDPHEFQPRPEDLKTVADSQLVLLSAKHMEAYVGKLKESTGTKGDVIEVGDGFSSLKMTSEETGKTIEDPHWWHSIENMERATNIVRDAFIKVDPADKTDFMKNAKDYVARLEALRKWARIKISELPRDKRKLVTSHDAFQYFAKENGFTIYAIEGISTADQPSSKKIADLIATVKAQGVKAIFPESIENPKVLQEVTKESGAAVGGKLYADGLGTGDASTYEGMYKHNVTTIVDALK
ncbi:MAG TPA: zinc ABC transporter substrate-binding protein [Chthoniobacteraceae bacterium]|jgi:ABC-type Zn uptake system ZnuABC Zn-binding protein ZnuA